MKRRVDPVTAGAGLQMRGHSLLQGPAPADLALLILVHTTTSDAHHYSVTHGLLVAVLCEPAVRARDCTRMT